MTYQSHEEPQMRPQQPCGREAGHRVDCDELAAPDLLYTDKFNYPPAHLVFPQVFDDMSGPAQSAKVDTADRGHSAL